MKVTGSMQNAARIFITLEGFMGGAWAERGLKRQGWGRGASQGRMLSLPQTIRPGDSLPDEAMTLPKWNSWVRVRRADVYWKTPRTADITQGPQDMERGRGPPSLIAKEHFWGERQGWGWTHTHKSRHHTPVLAT